MIKFAEINPERPLSQDLEAFWIEELEQAPDLSYRLAFLLALRKNLLKRWFGSLIKEPNFRRALEVLDRQARKWDAHGRKPSDETVEAFLRMLAGGAFEDVSEEIVAEALSRPTRRRTQYERSRELALREQAVRKKVYRVMKSLEARGLTVRHKPKLPREWAKFVEMIRLAESGHISETSMVQPVRATTFSVLS